MKTIIYHQNSEQCQALIKKDPLLKDLFEDVISVTVNIDEDYFKSLAFTILSQQLSSKVAQVIIDRFLNLYQGKLNPENIIKTEDDVLRSIGLSYQKISYIKSLSQSVIDKTVNFDGIEGMSNEDIKLMLIKVKGIGPWSADMFLMFSLGREDVFSSLDLGLRNACKRLYHNQDLSMKDIENLSLKWEPYRSIVSHFLWHMHDRVFK
jgi:DNA-3-methyladenine glycosylase II